MKCAIGWIGCDGEPTYHDAPAEGFAVMNEDGERFPCCRAHWERAAAARCQKHEQGATGCAHRAPRIKPGEMFAGKPLRSFAELWRWEPLDG